MSYRNIHMKKKVLILYDAKGISFEMNSGVIKLYKYLDLLIKKHGIVLLLNSIKKLSKENDVIILALDAEAHYRLKQNGVVHKTIDDYISGDDRRNMDVTVMSFVRELGNKKSLKKLVDFHGISLWDILELEIYGYGFFGKIIRNHELIKCVINNENPDMIFLKSENIYYHITKSITQDIHIRSIYPAKLFHPISRLADLFVPYVLKYLRRKWRVKPGFFKVNKKSCDKDRIVVLSSRSQEVNMILPWAKEVNDRGYCVKVIGLINQRLKYEKNGVNFELFSNFMTKEVYRKTTYETALMEKKWQYLKENTNIKEDLNYKTMSTWDLSKNKFSYLYFERFLRIIDYIEIIKNVTEVEKPEIIVVMDDRSGFGKSAVATGNLLNIPTLLVQHGLINDSPVYGPSLVDKMAVFGNYTKEVLIKLGVYEQQIVVTGQPRFDKILNNKYGAKKFRRQLGINENKRIIVWAAAPLSPSENTLTLIEIVAAVQEIEEVQLVVKFHPDDNMEWCRSKIEEIGIKDIVLTRDGDLYELLHVCDVLITKHSTVALEAMIFDKNVITINLSSEPDGYPYAESGASVGVYKNEEILPAIKMVLNDEVARERLAENRKKFVYEHAYIQDGKATNRVADLIEEMIYEKK